MDPDVARLMEASGALDPADRALLSLWLERDLDDATIADLIASTPSKVAARRTVLVRRLTEVTGADADQVRVEVERLAGRERREDAGGARSTGDGGPSAPAEEGEGAAPRSIRAGLVTLLALLLISGLVFALVATINSREPDPLPPLVRSPEPPPAAASVTPLTLVSVSAGSRTASGTGELVPGGALRLRLRGLAPGRYAVWAFNSIREARRVATFRGPAATVRARMPSGRYRYLDISREPDDGNPAHSGQSVLRAQL